MLCDSGGNFLKSGAPITASEHSKWRRCLYKGVLRIKSRSRLKHCKLSVVFQMARFIRPHSIFLGGVIRKKTEDFIPGWTHPLHSPPQPTRQLKQVLHLTDRNKFNLSIHFVLIDWSFNQLFVAAPLLTALTFRCGPAVTEHWTREMRSPIYWAAV